MAGNDKAPCTSCAAWQQRHKELEGEYQELEGKCQELSRMGLQSRDFQPEEIVSREALATEVQLPCVQSQPLLRSPQPSVDAEMPQAPAELANGTNGQRQQAPTEIHGSTSGQQQQAPIQSRDMSDTEIQLRQHIGDIENLLRQRNAETARMKKGRFEGEEWQPVAKAYVDHLKTSTDEAWEGVVQALVRRLRADVHRYLAELPSAGNSDYCQVEKDCAYSHSKFMEEIEAAGAKVLVSFSRALMGTDENDRFQDHRIACMVAGVIDAEDKSRDGNWEWAMASAVMQQILSLTGSREAMALGGRAMPGSVSADTYHKRLVRDNDAFTELKGRAMPDDANALGQFDNIGNYIHDINTARASVAQKFVANIVTNVEGWIFRGQINGKPAPFTQGLAIGHKHSPMCFKPLVNSEGQCSSAFTQAEHEGQELTVLNDGTVRTPEGIARKVTWCGPVPQPGAVVIITEVEMATKYEPAHCGSVKTSTGHIFQNPDLVPATLMELHTAPVFGDEQSEQDVFDQGVSTYLREQFQYMLEHGGVFCDNSWHDKLEDYTAGTKAREAAMAEASMRTLNVACTTCNCVHAVATTKQVCDWCGDHDTIPYQAARQEEKNKVATSHFAGDLMIGGKRRHKPKTKDVRVKAGKAWTTTVIDELEVITSTAKGKLERYVLPITPVNPNNRERIKTVLRNIGKYLKVRGFVPDAQVKREWAYAGSDYGAALTNIDPETEAEFMRFHWIPGTGHEDAVYLSDLCETAQVHVGDQFALLHGFPTEAGKNLLASAKSKKHISRDYLLEVLRPAFVRGIIRAYLSTCSEAPAFEDFHTWLQVQASKEVANQNADLQVGHKNANLQFAIKFWCLETIPAYVLFREGIEEGGLGNYTKFSAGRKKCSLVLYKQHNTNYLPLVLDDVALVEHRCTAEVRTERRTILSCNGMGFDWQVENGNHVIKRHVGGVGSTRQWALAQMIRAFAPGAKKQVFADLGIPMRSHDEKRTPIDLTVDVYNSEMELHASQVLNPDRTVHFAPCSVMGKVEAAILNPNAFDLFWSSPGNVTAMRDVVRVMKINGKPVPQAKELFVLDTHLAAILTDARQLGALKTAEQSLRKELEVVQVELRAAKDSATAAVDDKQIAELEKTEAKKKLELERLKAEQEEERASWASAVPEDIQSVLQSQGYTVSAERARAVKAIACQSQSATAKKSQPKDMNNDWYYTSLNFGVCMVMECVY